MIPKVGDIAVLDFPQVAIPGLKPRPALVLSEVPGPYQRWLLCGISTQLYQLVADWDELLLLGETWFAATGLERDSISRLSYLHAAREEAIKNIIGHVPDELVIRQRQRLSAVLVLPIS